MSLPANADHRLFTVTDEVVHRKVEEMAAEGFPNGACDAFYMGVHCRYTQIVSVRRKESSSPDEKSYRGFNVEDWVPCHSYNWDNLPPLSGEPENTRIMGEIRPPDEDDRDRFVILWESQACPPVLQNRYVVGLCMSPEAIWHGGILILKTDRDGNVENMTEQDKDIVMRMASISVWASLDDNTKYQPTIQMAGQ